VVKRKIKMIRLDEIRVVFMVLIVCYYDNPYKLYPYAMKLKS